MSKHEGLPLGEIGACWFVDLGNETITFGRLLILIRWMGFKWLFSLLDTQISLVCDSMRIKVQTSRRPIVKRDWTMCSNIYNYSTLDNEHNWEDLCIQLRNQHTCTSNNHKLNQGRSDFQFDFCKVSS